MKRRVLFVCHGNCCRSLMAAALLHHTDDSHFEVTSASDSSAPPDRRALEALDHLGVPHEAIQPRSIQPLTGRRFDFTIALCDKHSGECRFSASLGDIITWDFADPVERSCFRPFYTTARELRERIRMFCLVQARHFDAQTPTRVGTLPPGHH